MGKDSYKLKFKDYFLIAVLISLSIGAMFFIKVNGPTGFVTYTDDGRSSCEADGTCCYSLTYSGPDELCWTNLTWDDCPTGEYCPEAHHNYDAGSETYKEIHQLHTFGAEWHFGNPDDMNNAKGGIFARTQFRSYGNIHNGLISGSGSVSDYYCTSWKCMVNGQSFAPAQVRTEAEGIVWNKSYFGWTAAQCIDSDNCDASGSGNTDGINLKWSGIPTTNIVEVDEAGYSCSDCLIIEYNESLSATSYDPAITVQFVIAVHPRPDFYEGIGSATDINLYWNASTNETINITYGTFRKPYASDLSEWVGNTQNYLQKEQLIRNWTRDFYSAFNYPYELSEQNKTDYYNSIYSYLYNTMDCIDPSDTDNNYYVDGHCAVVNTPNKETYHGMWVWDSFNTGLGIVSSINWTSPNAQWVANITVGDWLKVWISNQQKYPVEQEWVRTIKQYSSDSGTQSEGGWALLALNLYDKNVISVNYLCTDVIGALRSDFEARQTADADGDGKLGYDSASLGRDGTDAIYSSRESPDATYWHILDAISLANIYAACGNDTARDYMLVEFNKSVNAYEDFWNSSCYTGGCYWSYDSDSLETFHRASGISSFNINNDWASTPFANGVSLTWGKVDSTRAEYIVGDLLKNKYVDTTSGSSVGYTSISVDHQCYTSFGNDNTCVSGETWDGPSWAGVDNFWTFMAIRDAIERYNYTSLQNDLDWLESVNFNLFGLDQDSLTSATPYGSESYDSGTRSPASWGSNPYGWGGNIIAPMVGDYNIFSVLSFDPVTSQAPSLDCVNISDDMTITTDTIICTNTYYVNDSGSSGVIIFGAQNVYLDMNNSILIGNNSGEGIRTNNYNGVTISNGNITKYSKIIDITSNNVVVQNTKIGNASSNGIYIAGDDVVVNNVTFYDEIISHSIYANSGQNGLINNSIFDGINAKNYVWFVYLRPLTKGWIVENSNFSNHDGILIEGNNTIVRNNEIFDVPQGLFGSIYVSGNNNTIKDNQLFESIALRSGDATNVMIDGNTIYNTSGFTATIFENSTNLTIRNNIINWSDTGVFVQYSNNIFINNNIVDYTVTNKDIYVTAVRVEYDSSNIIIDNNTLVNYVSSGIYLRDVTNFSIDNNEFDQISQAEQLNKNYFNVYEPTSAIMVSEIYKGFTGDSTENSSDNLTNKMINYRSYNGSISGNNFDNDTQTYLFLQGAYNVEHDLNNYWYRSFQGPTYLIDKNELYNKDTTIILSGMPYLNRPLSAIFFVGYPGSDYSFINYTISMRNMTFKNVNNTQYYGLIIYNLSGSNIIINSSNSVTLAQNVYNYSITLNPGQEIIIYDNVTVVDNIPPSVNQNSPDSFFLSYDSSEVYFNCSASDENIISKISLLTNESGTLSSVYNQSFSSSSAEMYVGRNFSNGTYEWSCVAYDNASLSSSSDTRTFSVGTILPVYSNFDGNTTNFSEILLSSNVSNITLENSSHGKVNFIDNISILSGVNFDEAILIGSNSITVNTSMYPRLNVSAILTFYNINLVTPLIKKDGATCSACYNSSYANNTFSFTVTSFSTYTLEETPVVVTTSSSGGGGGGGGGGASSSATTEEQTKPEIIFSGNRDNVPADVQETPTEESPALIEKEPTAPQKVVNDIFPFFLGLLLIVGISALFLQKKNMTVKEAIKSEEESLKMKSISIRIKAAKQHKSIKKLEAAYIKILDEYESLSEEEKTKYYAELFSLYDLIEQKKSRELKVD